jgi:2-(1,2-epoxy-1,2-dihydrophenyl)acetyl-CoA isomerase
MYETIKYDVRHKVGWLTLNRPEKLNAFTEQMNKEIKEVLKEVAKDEGVRCLVITGEGRAFCSGEDLSGVGENLDHANDEATRVY